MNDSTRLSLVKATVRAGFATMQKSANASPQQQEVLQAAWPQPEEGLSKTATLARVLATGQMLDEAEASLAPA